MVWNTCCQKPWHLGHDMVLWWSFFSLVGIHQPQDTQMWVVANTHDIHGAPQFAESGGVVFSVTNPHSCPCLLPHNCQHQCLPRQFTRIYESVGWLGTDNFVIFNKMRRCVTYLTQPWKKSGVSLGRGLLEKTLATMDWGHYFFELLPVGSVEEQGVLTLTLHYWRPERKCYQQNCCSFSSHTDCNFH
jgi:hypothetical protein